MRKTFAALILVASLTLVAGTVTAKPFGYMQASVQTQQGTTLPILDGSIGWTVPQTKDQLGFLAYTWIQPDWAQMYFGPTYNPSWAPWLTVGFHIGAQMTWGTAADGLGFARVEKSDPLCRDTETTTCVLVVKSAPKSNFSLRYATSVQVYVDKFAFTGIIEFENKSFKGDNSNLMYDLTAKYGVLSVIKAEASGDNIYFNLNVIAKAHRFYGIGPGLEFQIPVAYMTVWVNWAPLEPEGWQIAAVKGDKWNPSRFWTGLAAGF